MGKADEGDGQALHLKIGGRVFQPVAAGVFEAESVERFAGIGDAGKAKVERMVIREAEHIEPGFLQIFAVAGRHPEGVAADRFVRLGLVRLVDVDRFDRLDRHGGLDRLCRLARAALRRFPAVGHRGFKVSEGDVRGGEKRLNVFQQVAAVVRRHSGIVRKWRAEHYVADGGDGDRILVRRRWSGRRLCLSRSRGFEAAGRRRTTSGETGNAGRKGNESKRDR